MDPFGSTLLLREPVAETPEQRDQLARVPVARNERRRRAQAAKQPPEEESVGPSRNADLVAVEKTDRGAGAVDRRAIRSVALEAKPEPLLHVAADRHDDVRRLPGIDDLQQRRIDNRALRIERGEIEVLRAHGKALRGQPSAVSLHFRPAGDDPKKTAPPPPGRGPPQQRAVV